MLFFFLYKIVNNFNFYTYKLNYTTKVNTNFKNISFKKLFVVIDYNNNNFFLNKLIFNELLVKFIFTNSITSSLLKILVINLYLNSVSIEINSNNIIVKKNTKFLDKNILYKSFNRLSYPVNIIRQKTIKKFYQNFINESEQIISNIKNK